MKAARLFFVLVSLALVAGCDSGNDERSDKERIVGTWRLSAVQDTQGDKTATFQATGTLTVSFDDATGQYELVYDPITGDDVRLAGSYQMTEALGRLNLSANFQGTSIQLPLGYDFDNDDTLVLTLEAGTVTLINALIPVGLVGNATLTFARR